MAACDRVMELFSQSFNGTRNASEILRRLVAEIIGQCAHLIEPLEAATGIALLLTNQGKASCFTAVWTTPAAVRVPPFSTVPTVRSRVLPQVPPPAGSHRQLGERGCMALATLIGLPPRGARWARPPTAKGGFLAVC
jgi:hypothetical protein